MNLRTFRKGLVLTGKQLRYAIAPPRLPARTLIETPYFSQWESPELVKEIIGGTILAKDDPRWQESGATDPDDYQHWSWSICGMACLKMALAQRTGEIHPTVELAKQVQKYGGYVDRGELIDGLFYKPFVTFTKEELGLKAISVPALHVQEILTALAAGNHAILSVSPEIRFPTSNPTKKGGHLVLAVGYDLEKQLLFIHNPSGFAGESQRATPVNFANFAKFFDNKGIILRA